MTSIRISSDDDANRLLDTISASVTLTRTGKFPLYCLALAENQMARPDSLLIEPKVWKNETFAPVIPTFTAAYLETMQLRIEENGSHLAKLQDGQQHELVERFADGYPWPQSEPGTESEATGMRM